MDWKLVLQLSLFGLAMGIATVFVIPPSVEPFCWLVIFGFCAYVIAKRRRDKHFQHGFFVSVVNSLWITSAHVLFLTQYFVHHPDESRMMNSMPIEIAPAFLMAMLGLFVGVVSGLVLGLFSLVAGRFVKPRTI